MMGIGDQYSRMVPQGDFIPVNPYVLRVDAVKPFDIYVRNEIGKKYYTLFSKGGTRFTSRMRQKLLLNRVSMVYVSEENREQYIWYIEENLPHIVTNTLVPVEHKAAAVYEAGRAVMQRIFKAPRRGNIVRSAKLFSVLTALVLGDRKVIDHLLQITEFDYSMHTHSFNVGLISLAFARQLGLGLTADEFNELAFGFFMHDIGKSVIPRDVITKPGPLTREEWVLMKTHPEKGYGILKEADCVTQPAEVIVLQHHERSGGAGYPRGLHGEGIHLYAKICSVADTFDAMTTQRCYQEPCSAYESMEQIKYELLQEGFDGEFFATFVRMFAHKP
ncbi:HD-GYP domain-containing protein [Thermodesulfobacteriota bacterium]